MSIEEMKLETKNVGEVEIFETGIWKGSKYTEKDLDEMVDNFKNGVAEPYITIDHSHKATSQFKDALKALALGFVDKLERRGKKLYAWFKQVPKTVAELIEAGPLKKKSIEFYKQIIVNGKPYKNVLQGVTFHGANGLPEVNTLSDFLTLYKSNLQTMDKKDDGVVSFVNEDKEETKTMDNEINLKRDEYNELLKKSSQVDVFQNQMEAFKKQMEDNNKLLSEMKAENEKFKKEHEDFEKAKTENLKKEADTYISKKINDGYIKPAHKDRYVNEYIMYKKQNDNMFESFKDDIESRGKILNMAPTPGTQDKLENFKYNPEEMNYKAGATINYDELNDRIEQYKNTHNCTWEEAAIKCEVLHKDDLGFRKEGA